MLSNIYNSLKKEENSKKLGFFRILTAILGGFISAYLAMVFLAKVLPFAKADLAVVSLFFNTLTWTFMIFWIILAPTKLSALLRFLIPTLVFSITIYFLY